jgi:hypothetical protein
MDLLLPKKRQRQSVIWPSCGAYLKCCTAPVLAKWHPLLLAYENTKEKHVSPLEHEKRSDTYEELRQVLNDTRNVLTQYANLLAQAADVPSLIKGKTD